MAPPVMYSRRGTKENPLLGHSGGGRDRESEQSA